MFVVSACDYSCQLRDNNLCAVGNAARTNYTKVEARTSFAVHHYSWKIELGHLVALLPWLRNVIYYG